MSSSNTMESATEYRTSNTFTLNIQRKLFQKSLALHKARILSRKRKSSYV